MIVQIYAFTRVDQALQAAEMGVDQIGFVAGKYGIVHGELTFPEARRMCAALSGSAQCVALTMASDVDEILRMVEAVGPDIVHISTEPEVVGLREMESLRRRLPGSVRLMKAIPVDNERGGATALDLAQGYAALADILLLDTSVIGMPGVGATGQTHDWNISRRIVQAVGIPVILAGGLTPENVAEAIRVVAPAGVDSNTATNLPGSPVEKDMKRVKAFVQAARAATSTEGRDE